MIAPAFWFNLDVADLRQVLRKRREESRIDEQLLLLFDATLDALLQMLQRKPRLSFVQFN